MIDVNLIPEDVKIRFAKVTLECVRKFYKNKENKKAFEEWLKIRNNNT